MREREPKARKARIAHAGNTQNHALAAIRKRGYSVFVYPAGSADSSSDYCAVKDDRDFIASDPVTLLGLIAMWEEYGDNWREVAVPDDTFNYYAALTLREIREDLAETLSDLVINAGQEDAASFLEAVEEESLCEALSAAPHQPSEQLARIMRELIKLEPYGHLPATGFELVKAAIEELRRAVGITDRL